MEGEFTGSYNRCLKCGHIYDFEDRCPECGSEDVEDLNAREVLEWAGGSVPEEEKRLLKMLELHDDL